MNSTEPRETETEGGGGGEEGGEGREMEGVA